jgi:cyanophycin synthetase
MLTEITVDAMTRRLLEQENLTLDTVLPKGRTVYLKTTGNLSTGGVAEDVTDTVHSSNVFMAERIARIIDLDVCGIDVMAPSLSEPLQDHGGAVIEVNGAPGFRMHLAPTVGQPRNVAAPVLDMLFPQPHSGRIPILSVTGTNGKTTTTRLIAHMMMTSGRKVGMTTTDGIYIRNSLLFKGDCSGPESARFVLRDPTVDCAVFETARGGMMRSGLGYDMSDVGVVTNVASDHLGLRGIHSVEQLARLKSLVAENVRPEGYAVLNADDANVLAMKEGLACGIALFSMDPGNARVHEHCARGGTAAVYEDGSVVLRKGDWTIQMDKVINIPLTYFGKAAFQIQNVLAASLAAFVHGASVEEIRLALQTFVPSSAQLPGRMNLFEFERFKVLIDYAHNPASLEAIGRFVASLGISRSVAILAGTGDRRDEDLRDYGWVAAEFFQEVIVWVDEDYARGRDSREIAELILQGARDNSRKASVRMIPDEDEAVDHALKKAAYNSIVCVFTGRIEEMTTKIKELKEKELNLDLTRQDIPNISYMG